MTTANWVWSSKTWATTTVIFGGILIAASDRTLAQVVPDNTLGSGRSRVTPIDQQNDRIDGGVLRGANLFHSFQDFGVEANRGVQFSNPTGVENIFSRVTGNTPSNIYGTLGVQGNANLFLLNPNGILFGPNARLDLRGSFVASTADSFVFPDGSQFSATNPTAPPLLEINVQAPIGLQFAGEQPGLIVNSGNLQVDPGQNLALAGGTVVSTGELSAPGGDIAVVTVQSNGVAPELMPVLQFSRRGQLLGQTVAPRLNDGSTASATVTSLPEMVTEWGANTGLAISPSGQVELADSGLSVAAGDVAVQQLHAATATLSAANDLTLAASHLETTGNLQLLAQDTVRARDSEATPFVASAGGELLVQGNQGVDIFALNHPSSGLFSGGDMVLRSANTVGGDAHYWSGGNFRIEQLNGTPGSLFSPHDPIVRAAGDVEFDSYNGASLHIFAGGSVRINNITITGPDIISQSIRENVTLSNGEVVPIDGSTQPTLDIRAGTTAFIPTGIVGSPDGFTPAPPNTNGTGTSADIEIGNITITINDNPTPQERGRILLTNQYQPNPLLRGNISIGSINRNIFFQGSSIDVDSRNGITLNRNTSSGPAGGPNSDVTFLANGDITLNPGSYLAGRTINLTSNGAISIIGSNIRSDVEPTTDISRGEVNIIGRSVSLTNGANILVDSGSAALASSIFIRARRESVIFSNGASVRAITSGQGNAGSVIIRAGDSVVFNGRLGSSEPTHIFTSTSGDGDAGAVFIRAGNRVRFANGAYINSGTTGSGQGGNVRIRAKNSVIFEENANVTSNTTGRGNGGHIRLRAINGRISFDTDSFIASQSLNSTDRMAGNAGRVTLRANSGAISFSDLASIQTATFGSGNGGRVTLRTLNGSIFFNTGSAIFAGTSGTSRGAGRAGNVLIDANERVFFSGYGLTYDNRRQNSQVFAGTSGLGNGGRVRIQANRNISVTGDGVGFVSNTEQQSGCSQNQCQGGEISLSAESINLNNGAQVSAVTIGAGSGGKVEIQSDTVSIDHAGISVRAEEEGDAGTIRISAGTLTLDNQAEIAATAQISQGGNITLQTDDYVLMRRGSSISAISEGAGSQDGTIDLSDTGVIVTSPLEDNDVLARSERGGDIELNATLGFQIQQGLTQVEGRSDITGTGDISVNLNVDPNRSLTPLPAEPDSPEISNACQVSSDRRTAEFYNVGRGGLRSRPDEPLNPNTVAEDWIPLELAKDNSRSESNQAPVSQPPTSTSRASSPCQSL